ncbi:MAG: hypothetical protein LAO09_00670 [Acidobacteriia bacterium]|nr:hypothetical protein [Terriglobia bacterium]
MKLSSLIFGTIFAVVVIAAVLWILGFSFHAPASGQGAALYNPADEVTASGVVQEIQDYDCPVSEFELSRHLMLKTADGSIEVHLAPNRILHGQKLSFSPGDQVQVVGSKVRLAGKNGIIARELTRHNETIIFRDHQGKLLLVQ